MQSEVGRDASAASNGNGQTPMSVEDAVGNAFLEVLAEAKDQGYFHFDDFPDHRLIQAFAKDVRRRKDESPLSYKDFVDLAASAAVRVLIYGPDSPDERRDPTPLTLYRRMLWRVKRASPETNTSPDLPPQSAAETVHRPNGDHELEAVKHRESLAEAHDSGFSAGFEAGTRTEAAKHQTSSAEMEGAYGRGFAAGQRRLMHSEIAFAFTRGQEAEKGRIRARLEMMGEQGSQARTILEGLLGETTGSPGPLGHTRPESASTTGAPAQGSQQYSSRGSESSHASPSSSVPKAATASDALDSSLAGHHPTIPQMRAPETASGSATLPRRRTGRPRLFPDESERRVGVATCVFCGIQISQNSILRHKRRHHPAELAAVGIPLQVCACWWPGCGQLRDNLVHNQLTTHLQRRHNFAPPGDPNAFTENIKYLRRMPIRLQLSIICEAAQQLNAVKLRIQGLEARLRRARGLSYISRHGLPDVSCLHESRPRVLAAILKSRRQLLPYIVQELRQLARARGRRSQVRGDEGTWWEVADDLEAGLDPSGKLARAVAALPPPGSGPTVPLSANTLSEAPNMNDPSWRPQYAVPLQTGREVVGTEDNPVWTRAGPGARERESGAAAEPAVKDEPGDDEQEDGSYQDLIAEISRRVLDDKPQSDWDESSSDEDGDEPADTGDETARDGPDQSNGGIGPPLKRKTPATTASSPRVVKHPRAV